MSANVTTAERPVLPGGRPIVLSVGSARVPHRTSGGGLAFTLVELLVVMAIIGVLFAAVLTGRNAVMGSARTKDTKATLQIVQDALEEFKREQTASPTIIRAKHGTVRYEKRYGKYPPDELEVFTPVGLPNSAPPGGSLAVGSPKPEMVPKPPGDGYPPMDFDSSEEPEFEHRDLVAMVLAIDEFGDTSKAILDKIPDNRRTSGPVDAEGKPLRFLDRDDNGTWDAEVDGDIRLIVDGWGVPLTYFAQRDFVEGAEAATVSPNAPEWNEGSTEMIRLNHGQPIILSYGPDGRDQLAKENVTEHPTAILINDFEDDHKVNDPSNADNVYVDDSLKEKLAKGISEGP